MSTRGSSVSAFAIALLLGLVALAAVPAAFAAGPPTRPLALQSAAGDAAVTLSWLAPSSDGGSPITAYKVYRGTNAGGESLLVTLGDVRTYFDSGLVNGRAYYYQVSAVNVNGEGILSNEVSATPPQVVGIRWVRQFGATTSVDDFARAMAIDASGEYVAGETPGTLPGQTRVGATDAFLQKYDVDGNVTWTRQFGTILADSATALTVDASGVYVAGGTFGTFPGQTSAGGRDVFVQSSAPDGNVLWIQQFGTPGEDAATAIVVGASGVYVAGYTWGALPGWTNAGFNDVFLQKYDTAGNPVWTRQFGTSSRDSPFALAVDASGVYVAGYVGGILPGETGAGYDAFLRKYDVDGAIMWTRQFGTAGGDNAYGVTLDASGVYVAGDTTGTFPGETNAGISDVFLRKYDADGAVLWTHQFGTSGSDVYLNNACCLTGPIAVDASGMYLAGSTSGTFSGQTSAGGADAFLASLNQIPAQPPGPPVSLQAAAGDGTVDLTWYQPASDGRSPVTNYRIYRGTTSGSLTFLSMIGTVLSYADTGRTNGVTYYYAVSAVNAAGEGARSGEVSATPMGTGTAPSAAQNLIAAAGKVYRGTTSGSESLLVSLGTVLTYLDTGAANGQIYYYQVSAVNGVGEGPKSNEASATPTATDSTLPTIAIGSPADNSVLTSATVTVTGVASDNVAVEKVELSTDGTTWTLASGTTSWSGSVTLRSGANTIRARATDTSGNQYTVQVTVTVQTAKPGPVTLDLMLLAGIVGAISIAISYVAFRVVIKVRREKKERPPPPR
ncbi:MAG: hypothetical protein E6K10_07935 [Methanobacteriota archaeon]|nr:MAG: hypothetical protein E6K10_07935 [Euryarchaeota archaeon]